MERRSVYIYYTGCKYTMKDIELSQRMRAVADMVRPGSRVCDIGCDHAFVSIYLVANGIADRVIASDVRTGPCAIARDNIARWNMSDRIDLRLGDGLSTIHEGEAESVIIAGMGGMLITDILENGKNVVRTTRQLVLQPQSEIEHVRRYIHSHGWVIQRECMLKDAGKYYVVMDVRTTQNPDQCSHNDDMLEIYYKYGRVLIEGHSPVLKEYLLENHASSEAILDRLRRADTDNSRQRAIELEHELQCIEMALERI